MPEIFKSGDGKTLYIKISIYPCGGDDPEKHLTISCPNEDIIFKTTLSDIGLHKFKDKVLEF